MFNLQRLACVFLPNLAIQIEQFTYGPTAQLIVPDMLGGETVAAVSPALSLAGVEIGMSLYQSKQIAPAALIVEPDEEAYHLRHDATFQLLKGYSDSIETVGLGEFLIDIRGLDSLLGDEAGLAKNICEMIRTATALAVCVGIGSGKYVAQQAAHQTTLDSALVIPVGAERDFLSALDLSALPNLPGEMRRRLNLLDIHTLGDLASLPKAAVLRQFGAEAATFYELARGHDVRPLQPDVPPLRLVQTKTLLEPVSDRQIICNLITHLSSRLSRRLQLRGYHTEALKLILEVGRRTPIRLEYGLALKPPTADETRLGRIAIQLLGRIGIVEPVAQISLCAYPLRSWHHGAHQIELLDASVSEKQSRLDSALQLIFHRFGNAAVKLATLLGQPLPIRVTVRLRADGSPLWLSLDRQQTWAVDDIHEHWREERGWAVDDIHEPWREERGWGVDGVHEHWREERDWWSQSVRRDYYRVILTDGSLRNLFQDLNDGTWYLDRAWPIL